MSIGSGSQLDSVVEFSRRQIVRHKIRFLIGGGRRDGIRKALAEPDHLESALI
jgi:hypothetical protein